MTHRLFLSTSLAAALLAGAPAHAQHGGRDFVAAFDTDRDGRLTRNEYDAARAARFAASDTNHSGGISEAEYIAEFSPRLEQLVAQEDGDEKKREQRQRQVRQARVRFGVIDTNKDGRIDRTEIWRWPNAPSPSRTPTKTASLPRRTLPPPPGSAPNGTRASGPTEPRRGGGRSSQGAHRPSAALAWTPARSPPTTSIDNGTPDRPPRRWSEM